jgi:hypothetical protein
LGKFLIAFHGRRVATDGFVALERLNSGLKRLEKVKRLQ